ncbi:MAG TPA: hypothetical protein VJQ54_04610 [Candidatus Sulfotelmatobacter sp.]|nr:hypothetical protein [Candidatus Sulfotelmatobacter sp.]
MRRALSRRTLLATPLLVSTCTAATAAAAVIASDELGWMIDTYEEIATQRAPIGDEIDRIAASADQPDVPKVVLSEVVTRELDYPRRDLPGLFRTEESIERYFVDMLSRDWVPKSAPYRARVAADRDGALALLRSRRVARTSWLNDSGMNALEEQYSALSGKLYEIERWMAEYKCRSLGDVIAIAAFAERWLPGDEPDIDARSNLLRVISAYAVAAVHPRGK